VTLNSCVVLTLPEGETVTVTDGVTAGGAGAGVLVVEF
jgi:hypothetical protein